MFTSNTRKYIVTGSCVGMIILDVVLMVASNVDNMENGYSNMDSKLDFMDICIILLYTMPLKIASFTSTNAMSSSENCNDLTFT